MKCLKTLCMIMTLSFMMSGNVVFAQVDYEPPVPIKGLDGYTICYHYADDYYIADPDGKRVTPDYIYKR